MPDGCPSQTILKEVLEEFFAWASGLLSLICGLSLGLRLGLRRWLLTNLHAGIISGISAIELSILLQLQLQHRRTLCGRLRWIKLTSRSHPQAALSTRRLPQALP